ncbi:HAD family phosphatase [Methylomonas sp. MO1]|uniref:HAD family hydrolase n=1 Tax=Methylomonas sp. MO1 TaxID=3073619 RepID=UPI0028A4125D|nr:HAD family phosphatase [Methylomonas sp. MO1]MDT4287973.1 HAD family phosphatase [Methylomonas sp. MO1]
MRFPSLLLFDLGGVLIESSVFEHLNRLLPKPLENSALKTRWLHSPAVQQFERGESTPEEFAERFIAEWGLRVTPRIFLKKFASWPRQFFPGARETISDLRTNYRVGCLSNSNPLHWQHFGELKDDFDITLFSHLLGAIKPDPEIFALALSQCEVEPSEVYFFDDCSANVQSAQNLGITAFHVDGFESLQDVLNVQGLMP